MVDIQYIPCNKSNYGSSRSTSSIKYIVIHYTANDGDSAPNNGNYFKNNVVSASAHYFVDDNVIVQSVQDNYVAWAVGGSKYNNGGGRLYKIATNSNTISIELCDMVKNGTIAASEATIQNALDLVRTLMVKYNIPVTNVIRHYDVTGKPCPAYWVDDNRWRNEFWNRINEPPKPEPLPPVEDVPNGVYRLYSDGEHFYTINPVERDTLRSAGWGYEGVGWMQPESSNTGVYRLYNPNNGKHFFTADVNESAMLSNAGWAYEGVAFLSDEKATVPIYRLFNPNGGEHFYTASAGEKNALVSMGWKYEGIGFYGA